MLQQKKPKDYVIATGKQISVRKFVEIACFKLGFEIKWKYNKLKEIGYVNKIRKNYGYNIKKNQVIIKVNKKYFRPNEVNNLLGDAKLARKELGWKSKISVKQLIDEMIEHEIQSYS
jgi:GDPmannose 4,6-dehydratase